jgi:hypothetical protein
VLKFPFSQFKALSAHCPVAFEQMNAVEIHFKFLLLIFFYLFLSLNFDFIFEKPRGCADVWLPSPLTSPASTHDTAFLLQSPTG